MSRHSRAARPRPRRPVGGDFFDYAANADGLWLVFADATGKGNSAAALSSLAIGALRAARRAGAGLHEAARLGDEAILTLDMQLYLTAVLGSWDPSSGRLRSPTAAPRGQHVASEVRLARKSCGGEPAQQVGLSLCSLSVVD